jgi:hypothetical protein
VARKKSDDVWAEWIAQAKADGTYDAAVPKPSKSKLHPVWDRLLDEYGKAILILIAAGVLAVALAIDASRPPPDLTGYSDCEFFAGSAGVIADAECVEDGEVIRWKDSRHYFSYPREP